ncbi:alpha/beta fold hydrolase [Rhizomonospora bruguierae]|uniref:alpha/beta fold hydrolase n=1 Tax=Rhizomonospora bruguierae TaxID=1581705 RepID=UPI001BD0D487|nr:alpha/beta fold hydrolase [Micromonospora sp. NBRC 107566]
MTRRRAAGAGAVALVLIAALAVVLVPRPASYRVSDAMLTVRSGPDGNTPVRLDTRYYAPKSGRPVPAVLLAHGFGGTKETVGEDAKTLADRGYAVLTWTARGFGRSGDKIHLNAPDYEVRDAQRLLDWLATRPEVRQDGPGDPRVGVVGGSYGGGLALMLAGLDRRVDAIVPMITWNDLSRAFLPDAGGGAPVDGVFKRAWAGLFFGSGSAGPGGQTGIAGSGSGATGPGPGGIGAPDGVDPTCGRFAEDVCRAYLSIATTGRGTPAGVDLLRRSSPATVLDRITAPTLLIQGLADSLFPLTEADANAAGIAAHGTPVRVAWFTGGHDGGAGPQTDQDRLKFLTAQWLDHYLKGEGPVPSTGFTWSRISGFDALDRGYVTNGYQTDRYPGLAGSGTTIVELSGPPQPAANPPAGTPAALSSIPLAGALSSFVNGVVRDVPGQHADFVSAPVERPLEIAGAPRVSIRAASPTGSAVLFLKLYDVAPDGTASLPGGQVAPVRLTGLPADIAEAGPVTVTLPGVVRRIEAGHRLRVTVATADQAYAGPVEPTVYTVALGDGRLTVPTISGTPIASPAAVWRWVLLGLVVALAVGLAVVLFVARRRRRAPRTRVDDAYADVPLVVRGLRKAYADGFVAVSRVDFEVRRGQVVGLLGPNGAGKTTTLRVLMGLTRPTAGDALVFGHRLTPGAPVLSRIGALVEGPGFLPHLTGLENLRMYWRSTGRAAGDARFPEALEIAGLGESVHRKVRTYSHGMRQRLAIAQAMLGLPELLVLDEPTDGLDPPQIAEMRRVLRRYATDGRAVLVSSHLLAEVEQTCTDVVVVHKGEVVAAGPVDQIVGESPSVQLDVSDVDAAAAVLDRLGVRSVAADGAGLVVDVNGTPRSELVAELVRAGVGVDRVVPRRRLEDAFLALVGESSRGSGDR